MFEYLTGSHSAYRNTLNATTRLKYRIVPCMRPWALAAKPENWGWPLTRRRCLNGLSIPVQVPTLNPKLTDRCYRIDSRRSLPLLLFFFRQTRPVQQQRKLYPARKRTNLKSRCHGFVAFVTCSTRILYCKRRTLRMRLQPVCANLQLDVLVPETH